MFTPVYAPFAQNVVMVHSIYLYATYFVSAVFLLGMAGSAVVVVISFFDDFAELFSKDDKGEILHSRPPTN
jgi:hypothetical protein